MDSSESRYAEIARKMLDYNDWTTPWFKPEQAFWGKPPFTFWSIAASFGLFGINELAARLPSLLFTLLTGWILFDWVKRHWDQHTALLAVTIYLSTWVVLYIAGTAITDPFLTFATTLVMVSFWDALHLAEPSKGLLIKQHRDKDYPVKTQGFNPLKTQGFNPLKTQGSNVMAGMAYTSSQTIIKPAYLTWIALALGLLAKGPVALVLCGMACGSWVLIYQQWQNWFISIRLFTGLALMSFIAFPWYFMAEQATPGFIDYFIVGEHFARFTQPAWNGDLYGPVKDQPLGLIWIYFIVALMPWSLFLLPKLLSRHTFTNCRQIYQAAPKKIGYLALWIIMPLIFFSLAKNILLTYVLPTVPACAVLMALLFKIDRTQAGKTQQKKLLNLTVVQLALLATTAFFILVWGTYYLFERHDHRNQKPLIEHYQALAAKDPGPLVYTGSYRFSAVFYSRDQVRFGRHTFRDYDHHTAYFAVRDLWRHSMVHIAGDRCHETFVHDDFSLWYCPAITPDQQTIQ